MNLDDLPRLTLKVSDLLRHKGSPQIRPLSPGKNPYHRNYNQKNKTAKPRQREFEAALLTIATTLGSKIVPIAFRDATGRPFVLDVGCVGHAEANGVVDPLQRKKVVRSVTLSGEVGKDNRTPLRKYCRICWNSAYWREPTGEAQHMEGTGHVQTHGYGHEEWLFNFAWKLKSPAGGDALFRYGFLQPIAKYFPKYAGRRIDVIVYTVGHNGQRLAVAQISNAYIPSLAELTDVFAQMRERGWIADMQAQLRGLGVPIRQMSGSWAPAIVNIRFREEDVRFFDPMIHITRSMAPNITPRYHPFNWTGTFPPLRAERPRAGKKATLQLKSGDDGRRQGTEGGVVRHTHTRIQNALYEDLCREHGEASVAYEEDCVDITLCHKGRTSLIEIKTALSAKACVRQALGQLLEYAHYPNLDRTCGLIVVGPPPRDAELDSYLAHLNARYRLPIVYRQWIETERRLASPLV